MPAFYLCRPLRPRYDSLMRMPTTRIANTVSFSVLVLFLFGAHSAIAGDAPATVHGTLMLAGKPKPNERISLFHLYPSGLKPMDSKTDAQGHYAFAAVESGEILIGYLQNVRLEAPGVSSGPLGFFSHTRVLHIESGKDYALNLGGVGRKVIGRMIAPSGLAVAWQYIPNRFLTSTVKRPTPPKSLTGPALDSWWRNYWRSSDNAELENSTQSIVVEVEKDGAFYADDVPPGVYRVEVNFVDPEKPGGDPIATVRHPFTVPDAAETAPLDLGAVPLIATGKVAVGDVAPDFSLIRLDGKPVDLKSLRGKYVLLNFWATWCGVCHEQYPLLQAIHSKWGADDRFVMLGISLDDDQATALTDTVFTKAPWPQALAGVPEKGGAASGYGVTAVPEYFLIDPNGKLLVVHCYDPSIQSAVNQALSE